MYGRTELLGAYMYGVAYVPSCACLATRPSAPMADSAAFDLQAVPFWATIDPKTGKCDWMSTSGSATPFLPKEEKAPLVEVA